MKRSYYYKGGTKNAKLLLEDFILNKLHYYTQLKNHPGEKYSSDLSPYLHFGQISPLYIYNELIYVNIEGKKDFLEELIVRRELSMNFVFYNNKYDSYDCLPAWSKATLEKHDRPWHERDVFCTVRYMNDKGLKRKFNMEKYTEKTY